MSINKAQNINRIFNEIFSICNREFPPDAIDALQKSLSTLLVLHYHKKEVKDIVIKFAKDVVKEYNDINSNEKGF